MISRTKHSESEIEFEDSRRCHLGREVWGTWRVAISNYKLICITRSLPLLLGRVFNIFAFPLLRFPLPFQEHFSWEVRTDMLQFWYSKSVDNSFESTAASSYPHIQYLVKKPKVVLIQQVWKKQCHSMAWENNPQQKRQKMLGYVIKTSPALTQKGAYRNPNNIMPALNISKPIQVLSPWTQMSTEAQW